MQKNKNRVTNPDALPMVLTPSDIMNTLGLSRNRVYELVHRGDFPAIKFGKQYRISKEKFLVWLDEVKEIKFAT